MNKRACRGSGGDRLVFLAACVVTMGMSTGPASASAAEPASVPLAPSTSKTNGKLTEAEAKVIALKAVPGRVTDVAIEKKRGKNVYVVEVVTDKNVEMDVLVDMVTGKVLGTE